MTYRSYRIRDREDPLHTVAMICWIAYAVGLVTSWVTGPIGFVLALLKQGDAHGTIYESHFAAVIRSGIILFFGYALGWLLVFTFIGAIVGIPILLVTWLYNIYVIVRGFLKLAERRPYD